VKKTTAPAGTNNAPTLDDDRFVRFMGSILSCTPQIVHSDGLNGWPVCEHPLALVFPNF
jgi:hypothetical protein